MQYRQGQRQPGQAGLTRSFTVSDSLVCRVQYVAVCKTLNVVSENVNAVSGTVNAVSEPVNPVRETVNLGIK